MTSVSVLEFWLSSLNMYTYYQSFIDNGYDDLEICKKVVFLLYSTCTEDDMFCLDWSQ